LLSSSKTWISMRNSLQFIIYHWQVSQYPCWDFTMLRWLITGLIHKKPRFNVRPVHMRFLVGRVALGQVFVEVFWFSLVSIIPSMLHTHVWFIYHWCHIILSIDSLTFKWPAFMHTNTCNNTARNLCYIFTQQTNLLHF